MLPLSLRAEVCTQSQRRLAHGERKSRGRRGLRPPWQEEKLSFLPRHSALPAVPDYFVHSAVTHRVPKPSRALHRHRGGPNLKMLPLSLRAEVLHSLTATASPMGKKMERWAEAPAPSGMEEKLSSPPPDTRLWPAVPVYLVHSAVTRGVPKPPVLCVVIGVGRILKMLPLSLRASSSTTTSLIYTSVTPSRNSMAMNECSSCLPIS